MLKLMYRKLVRKALEMIQDLADAAEESESSDDEDSEDVEEEVHYDDDLTEEDRAKKR